MKNPLLLALFILGICLFTLFYFVSSAFYKKRHKNKYHFYQMFPYEFNYPYVFKPNFYGNILMVLSCLCVIAFYELNPISSIYRIITIAISITLTTLIIGLLLLPLRYLRTHMILSTILMAISAALPLFNLFFALEQYKTMFEDANRVLCVISVVISGLLALCMLLLILNPKLSYKIYMDKSLDEEGKEVFVRPKIIFIALNEWWSIFTFFLSPISILLLTII